MKFCVFGFDKYFPKVAKASNNLVPDVKSFSSAIATYKHTVESEKYKEVYFLVDFGYAETPFWKAIDINYFGDDVVPWILLSIYKDGAYSNPMISKVSLKLKGFSEDYKDTMIAMEKFVHYTDLKVKCDLYADIFGDIDKYITSSQIVIKKDTRNQNYYCNKYRI